MTVRRYIYTDKMPPGIFGVTKDGKHAALTNMEFVSVEDFDDLLAEMRGLVYSMRFDNIHLREEALQRAEALLEEAPAIPKCAHCNGIGQIFHSPCGWCSGTGLAQPQSSALKE